MRVIQARPTDPASTTIDVKPVTLRGDGRYPGACGPRRGAAGRMRLLSGAVSVPMASIGAKRMTWRYIACVMFVDVH